MSTAHRWSSACLAVALLAGCRGGAPQARTRPPPAVTRRLDPGALVGPNYGSGAIVTVERIDAMRVFIPVLHHAPLRHRPPARAHALFTANTGPHSDDRYHSIRE